MTCTLTSGCGFPPHAPSDHPCGAPIHVGDPCRFCGDPIAADASGQPKPCPHCWQPVTIADIKAFAAEVGLDARVSTNAGGRNAR